MLLRAKMDLINIAPPPITHSAIEIKLLRVVGFTLHEECFFIFLHNIQNYGWVMILFAFGTVVHQRGGE